MESKIKQIKSKLLNAAGKYADYHSYLDTLYDLDEKYDETLEIYNKSLWFGQSDGTIREKAAHMLNITLNLFQDMANNSEKELFSVIQEILECNREDQYQIWEKELFLDKNKIQLDELKEELLEWEEFPYEQQKALDKLICTLDKINETLQ